MTTHTALVPAPLRLVVLLGTVRRQRFGPLVVDWVRDVGRSLDDTEIDFIDLAAVALPMAGPGPGEESPISDRLAAADGFLIVTPEYNHSFPAAVKNVVDWHLEEWAHKPVAFVGYGAGAGGVRAVEQLSQVFREVRAVTVRNSVLLSSPWERTTEQGFQPSEGERGALGATVAELLRWARALRRARAEELASTPS